MLEAAYRRYDGPLLDAALQGAAVAVVGPVVYLAVRSVRHGGATWSGRIVLLLTAGLALARVPLLAVVAIALAVSLPLVRTFGARR